MICQHIVENFLSHTGLAVGLGVSVAKNSSPSTTSPTPKPTSSVTPTPSPTPSAVCTTESCIQLAALILSNLNQSVHPCDDFYNFSCGGWEATHSIPEGTVDLQPLLSYHQTKYVCDKYSNTRAKTYKSIPNHGRNLAKKIAAFGGIWTLDLQCSRLNLYQLSYCIPIKAAQLAELP